MKSKKLKKQVEAHLPSKYGDYNMIIFAIDEEEEKPHFVLAHKDIDITQPVALRIHSECLTGDLLGSTRCDCGEQLEESMVIIEERNGVLIYLRQEGRGIGLINKLKAYNLQDKGLNTIDANIHLGFQADERHYEIALNMIKELGITAIDLITNNPEKINAIEQSDIILNKRIPLVIEPGTKNKGYLDVKKDKMGHLI